MISTMSRELNAGVRGPPLYLELGLITGALWLITTRGPLRFLPDGYLLHSPNPYRLWFQVGFNSGMKDPSQGNGLDYQRLLHEAEEEFAPAF